MSFYRKFGVLSFSFNLKICLLMLLRQDQRHAILQQVQVGGGERRNCRKKEKRTNANPTLTGSQDISKDKISLPLGTTLDSK